MMRFSVWSFAFVLGASGCATSEDREMERPVRSSGAVDSEAEETGDLAEDQSLQTDAEFGVSTHEIEPKLKQLKARVRKLGGKVISESVEGFERGLDEADLTVRVPIKSFDALVNFVRGLGEVTYQRITRTSIDEDPLGEDEYPRRGRRKKRRVQKAAPTDAVVHIRLTKPGRYGPNADRLIGLRYSNLAFSGGDDGQQNRFGGGFSLSHPKRYVSLDVSAYKPAEGEKSVTSASVGFATYSELLGDGKNMFLNPVIGMRLGVIGLDGATSWMVGIELGLEFVKYKELVLEGFARPYALFGKENSGSMVDSGVQLHLPF